MQQGGSQYGVPPPEMPPFAAAGAGSRAQVLGIPGSEQLQPQQQQQPPPPQHLQIAEAASPISSRPPPRQSNFDDLASTVPGNFTDDDAAGEEAERGVLPGNRWPRQETLALLKIRSEMDAAFRDATPKGPLWEDVSRKLAEMGYGRSAKKCKEKFENVHKYYKRTKEGRAGRQDGKNYRFFSQLEALHSGNGGGINTATAVTTPIATAAANSVACPSSTPPGFGMAGPSLQPTPLSPMPPTIITPRVVPEPSGGMKAAAAAGMMSRSAAAGISFSSNTSSSSASESDGEDTAEEGLPTEGRKRKRGGPGGGGGGSTRKMIVFFEGLLKQVMERQEVMQQRFLETIEKREQERMIREEAWKRQEMARLNREHESMAQECAVAASRDAAIIAFLQKLTGQTIQLPPLPVTIPTVPPPMQSVPPQPPQQAPPPPLPGNTPALPAPQKQHPSTPLVVSVVQEPHEATGGGSTDPASSRWPKSEVHALIKLRSGLDPRYQEAGPKGPLWEEISAGMRRIGYNRSSKRCKEKWENINKYFKKVKESNKKRPEDAKTCPYFHQLDALYRKKILGGSGSGSGSFGNESKEEQDTITDHNQQEGSINVLPLASAPPPQQQPQIPNESSNGKAVGGGNPEGNGGSNLQIQTSNGGAAAAKKPEGSVKKQMDIRRQQPADYDKLEEPDSDNMDQDEDDDDDDEDEEERKMDYKIQYQRPNVNGASNGSGGNQSAAAAAAAAAAAGSFLAMVQ